MFDPQVNTTVTKNSNNMYMKCGDGSSWINSYTNLVTQNAINLLNYNFVSFLLRIVGRGSFSANWAGLASLWTSKNRDNRVVSADKYLAYCNEVSEFNLNISSFKDKNYNIGMISGQNCDIYVHKVWIE